ARGLPLHEGDHPGETPDLAARRGPRDRCPGRHPCSSPSRRRPHDRDRSDRRIGPTLRSRVRGVGMRTVVIGAGAAGLWCALHATERGSVTVVAPGAAELTATAWAQGGVAAAIDPDDGPDP